MNSSSKVFSTSLAEPAGMSSYLPPQTYSKSLVGQTSVVGKIKYLVLNLGIVAVTTPLVLPSSTRFCSASLNASSVNDLGSASSKSWGLCPSDSVEPSSIVPSSGDPDSADFSVSSDSFLEEVVFSVSSSVSSPSPDSAPPSSDSSDSSVSSPDLDSPSPSSDSSSPYGFSDHSPFSSISKSSSSSPNWGIPMFSSKRSCIASSVLENSYNSSAMATTSSQVSAAKHLSSMTCSSAVNCRVRKAPTLA